MTFNVVNLRRQRSTSYVCNVSDVLIAISDDVYCLERDVTWRDVRFQPKYLCSFSALLSTQLNYLNCKRKEFYKETLTKIYKLVACQMFDF